MNIKPVIDAIRKFSVVFENRVYGAADFSAALDSSGSAKFPSAYVVPLNDTPNGTDNSGMVIDLSERFGVFVLMDASADARGQNAVSCVHAMRQTLFDAILGYEMDKESGPITYDGGELVSLDRARLFWRYDFEVSTNSQFNSKRDQTLWDALSEIKSVRVEVDAIDPMADPNTPPITDPAKGGYHGGKPGPDGRIEHVADFDLTTN